MKTHRYKCHRCGYVTYVTYLDGEDGVCPHCLTPIILPI